MSSIPDNSYSDELHKAKKYLDEGLYSPEDYAVVARASAAAQSLQIGIKAGVVVNNLEMQAAFFAALGLPGRPSGAGLQQLALPSQQPVITMPSEPSQTTHSDRSVSERRVPRHRRHENGGRPQDGLEREHRP